jgi:hypothetical protein
MLYLVLLNRTYCVLCLSSWAPTLLHIRTILHLIPFMTVYNFHYLRSYRSFIKSPEIFIIGSSAHFHTLVSDNSGSCWQLLEILPKLSRKGLFFRFVVELNSVSRGNYQFVRYRNMVWIIKFLGIREYSKWKRLPCICKILYRVLFENNY